MKYLFIDPVCPTPYKLDSLELRTLGGTEATVVRVAHKLVSRLHFVVIQQRGREHIEWDSKVTYTPISSDLALDTPDHVITLRDAGVYIETIKTYPHSLHYLWLHDVVTGDYLDHLHMHLKNAQDLGLPINIICVSNWHMNQVRAELARRIYLKDIKFRIIYNPVAEYCTKTTLVYDPYKLVFFSSPHKGLEQVLSIFKELHDIHPKFKLYLANPGYFSDTSETPEGVINLGQVPHRAIIEQVRTSLCMFYPQTTFPETFGLVLAESNAVGTPVIAHPIGAASEVLEHPKQLMDCNNRAKVIDTVLRWSDGERLIVGPSKLFTMNNVIKEWQRL